MTTPSVAKKLKDDLLRMADGKELFAIREGDNAKQVEAQQFKTVLAKEWLIKIGITANAVSQERHFNRSINLPEPSDVSMLATYLKDKLMSTLLDLQSPSLKSYKDVTSLVQVRLTTYNKRRPGEIENL